MALTAAQRSTNASIASNTYWARVPDRTAATEPARRGLEARFEREVDPAGVLPPAELAKRVANARAAYYRRLAKARWAAHRVDGSASSAPISSPAVDDRPRPGTAPAPAVQTCPPAAAPTGAGATTDERGVGVIGVGDACGWD